MVAAGTLGRIVVLNGAPRSGKSSIAAVIQERFPGVWMNLGVDRFKPMVPDRYQPGIGLRPGGERPDLEPLVALLYHALYGSIALHSRLGLNVVADVGHHDWYSMPREILPTCARETAGSTGLVYRRAVSSGRHSVATAGYLVGDAACRWHRAAARAPLARCRACARHL